jgi:hypothetical protein
MTFGMHGGGAVVALGPASDIESDVGARFSPSLPPPGPRCR